MSYSGNYYRNVPMLTNPDENTGFVNSVAPISFDDAPEEYTIPNPRMLGDTGSMFTLDNVGKGFDAVKALGSMWNSYQQNRLAKDSLAMSKQAYRANLANQVSSYNTALEDRIRARYNTQGNTQAEADVYIARNRL